MSIEFFMRMLGTIVFTILGVFLGSYLGGLASFDPRFSTLSLEVYELIFGLVGFLFGIILTPFFTTRPVRKIKTLINRLSAQTLVAGLIGLIIGLIIATLLSIPLAKLPSPFGEILPFIGVVIFCYISMAVFTIRQHDVFSFIRTLTAGSEGGSVSSGQWSQGRTLLLDTSVIIDGRIADIARTGFLPGTILIPRFVLNELQYIADSSENLKRQRGRRGMEVLTQLQKEPSIPVQISDIDVEGVREVDDKLIILARQMKCPILTNDFNMNRIAELQGVLVLNINELANAVKSVLLPGEILSIRLIQEGKEEDQGVGYMDDGTMVVVENGKIFLGKSIEVQVTKVLQTAAGRMIFARPEA